MSNDTTNENQGEETVEQVADETTENTENTESQDDVSNDSDEQSDDKVANLRKTIGSLKRELKKAKKIDTKSETTTASAGVSLEEVALVNTIGINGLAKAKRLAEIDNVPLEEAVKSEEFELWQKAEEERKRRAESQLSASGGGKSGSKKPQLGDSGLSREDHKKLAMKKYQG